MTLCSPSFVVFLDPYQGSNGVCLLSKYVVFLVWGIVILPSLSPYSNKVLISGAHRWEANNTYLQDIYCIVKPWIQKNKSISQIKMCMCGKWMVYGDDGDNNGESLILLLLFWGGTYLLIFGNAIRNWSASARISVSTSPGKLSRVSYLFFYH